MKRLVVAVTGASGAIYAQRLLRQAARTFDEIYLMVSRQGVQVANTELGLSLSESDPDVSDWLGSGFENIKLLKQDNFYTPPASGSFVHHGMIIVPCSMGTAGRIANGISNDLITRAADVCLKERRPLILVPREMPWSLIHLRNLTALTEAGATILPAAPAWYHHPKTLEDLADTVVDRILQQVGGPSSREWMVE